MPAQKLISREYKPENSTIQIDDVVIGDSEVIVIAGPCSVESYEQTFEIAKTAKNAGAKILRGGAFKPRTSPYSFQGLGEEGLKILLEVKKQTGLKIVTEILDTRDVELVSRYCDIFQVGTRNMYNYSLLQELGFTKKPILLKRGMCATIEEWLMAAEYILDSGNSNVILCERGIRTFETSTRNTLDISAVPVVKELSHLPIIVDPSHASGKYTYINSLSKAAIAAGADGVMIEVHTDPCTAMSDGIQSLIPEKFEQLMSDLKPVAEAVGRSL